MKVLFIKIKKNILSIIFLLFTICLVVFSKSNIQAVKDSLNIWVNNVIPSLFPFFIATELLGQTNIPRIVGNIFNKLMRPLFNVPGIGAYALFMGIITGYPVGAKIVTNFRNQNLCTKEEAERLITFTNNSGPLFILGTVGITMFYDTSVGILLLLSHILSTICVGIIFRFWEKNVKEKRDTNISEVNITFNSLGEILSKSILSAINSIVLIGGFIIFFGILLSILKKTHILIFFKTIFIPCFNLFNIDNEFIVPILTGFLELTNGVALVSSIANKNLAINVMASSFLLGFGGLSIMLQVLSIISKSDISIKPYILGKLLHGLISAFFTFLIINNFSYFSYLQI